MEEEEERLLDRVMAECKDDMTIREPLEKNKSSPEILQNTMK
jgi:hypothetical protein